MTDYLRGLDAATILTPYAPAIARAGFTAVGRYLKTLTRAEVDELHAHGIAVWPIYETGADTALGGIQAGRQHGQRAADLAQSLGMPLDVVIYATFDDTPREGQLQTVVDYFSAFEAAIGNRIGAYACGDVLVAIAAHPADETVPWLAGAMGWAGSRDYAATNAWMIKQGVQINPGGTMHWAGLDWPALPFAYDPDLIVAGQDLGFWQPSAPAPNPMPQPGPQPSIITIPSAVDMQKALQAEGLYTAQIDGLWGPHSQAALAAHYSR